MALKINYKLGDHGWADVHMNHGHQSIDMTMSYLHDTLAEFITAANLLLKGAPDAKVIAMDEPGEHLVHLTSPDRTSLVIEIRWFKDRGSWDLVTEKEFEVVFKCDDTILNFSTEIFKNTKRILDEHGAQGYKEKWIKHDFPMDEYNRLKSLLKK